jgi:hypothetical protein
MGKYFHKMRIAFAILAFGLSWHYVILAEHLACEVHPNCDDDSGQVFGSPSTQEHEHCLIQIAPARVHDSSIQDNPDVVLADFLFVRVWPEAPRVMKASRTPRPLMVRSRANFQFTQSVRIIS